MIKQDISELEEKHRDIVYQILSQHPYKFYAKAPPLIKISRKIRLVIRDLRWDKVPFFVMWIFLGWLEKKYKYN
jgi:hypothetical protein